MTTNRTTDAYRRIAAENLDLMVRKGRDYSNDNLTQAGPRGVATRALDKVVRLRNLYDAAERGERIEFESIDQTWADLSNYGLIGQTLERGELIPSTRLVYLAGPIDGVSEDNASRWRVKMSRSLFRHGIAAYDPYAAFLGCHQNAAEQMWSLNRAAIQTADALLAYLAGPGIGFGTVREIEFARSVGKRVIVVSTQLSVMSSWDLEVVETLSDALRRITGKEDEDLHTREGLVANEYVGTRGEYAEARPTTSGRYVASVSYAQSIDRGEDTNARDERQGGADRPQVTE